MKVIHEILHMFKLKTNFLSISENVFYSNIILVDVLFNDKHDYVYHLGVTKKCFLKAQEIFYKNVWLE